MKRFLWLALVFLFSACAPATETAVSPQPDPETAVPATQTAPPPEITVETPRVESPTAVPDLTEPSEENLVVEADPTAEETAAETGVIVISGRTEEGAFFLGDPDAPITHIDYSDFL